MSVCVLQNKNQVLKKESISEQEFNRLVFENQEIIHKVCHMYCHSQADKEDLFQEIVIKLWQGLPNFRHESKHSTWIYRVALNTAISQFRKRRKGPSIEHNLGFELVEKEEDSQKAAQIRALYQGISQLNKVEKAIILLYLERKSYEEIAEITGLSKSNVSVKLVRIRKKLEEKVKSLLDSNQ